MRSESLKKAQNNYNLNHDRIYLYLPFGMLSRIDKTGAKNRSEYIKQAITEKLEKSHIMNKTGDAIKLNTYNNIDLLCIAQRIIDIDYYNAMNHEETPETIVQTLINDPLTVFDYLLSIIEDLQEN